MRQAIVLAALLAVFATAPILGQAQSTSVAISVPPTQVLEGTTQLALTPGSPQSGRLVVKSNIPWGLFVEVAGAGVVSWRPAGGLAWTAFPARGVIQTGQKGVHTLAYEIQATGPTSVRFAVAPLP